MNFETYENSYNSHVTIHRRECTQLRKHGGQHKHDQGRYREHPAYEDAEAFAINGLLTSIVQRAVGRERPFAQGCGTIGHPACTPPDDRNSSFFSGHTSFAFTAATLLCFQHGRLNLYGDGDAVVCPVALAVASLTGLFRIAADRHWATDVLAGAAEGAAAGTVVSITHISAGRGTDFQAASTGASFGFAF